MNRIRIALVVVLSLSSRSALPCSLLFDRLDRPDPSEFVFTGRIIKITGPSSRDASLKTAVAAIQAERIVSGNLEPGPVEVSIYQLMPDCRARPAESDALQSAFPVGSQVTVIAHAAPEGSNVLTVTIGANSEIAAAGRGPSPQFASRQALASLSSEPEQAARAAMLQDLIPKLPIYVDFERAVNHFVSSEPYRSGLLASYRAYLAEHPQ